jgi:mRNA interferase MazF
VRRGDIYTAATRGAYSGKPRPVVVIQDDRLLRIPVQPSDTTGLAETSRLMVDKVTTVPRTSLTRQVGRLSDADLIRLNRALLVFLGLAV